MIKIWCSYLVPWLACQVNVGYRSCAQVAEWEASGKSRRFSHKHQRCTITSKRLFRVACAVSRRGFSSSLFFPLFFFIFFFFFSFSTTIATHCVHDECCSLPLFYSTCPFFFPLPRCVRPGAADRGHIRCKPNAPPLSSVYDFYFIYFVFDLLLAIFPSYSSQCTFPRLTWLPSKNSNSKTEITFRPSSISSLLPIWRCHLWFHFVAQLFVFFNALKTLKWSHASCPSLPAGSGSWVPALFRTMSVDILPLFFF